MAPNMGTCVHKCVCISVSISLYVLYMTVLLIKGKLHNQVVDPN